MSCKECKEKAALLRRWLKNEINHVFQNSTLQEDTKALLKDLGAYKEIADA